MQYSGPDHDPAADEAERIHPIIQEAAERMIEKDFGELWEHLIKDDLYMEYLYDAASAARQAVYTTTGDDCLQASNKRVMAVAYDLCWDNRDEIVRAYDERKADERAGV